MINLGDITKIDGTAHPIPSVVIGGSPCQDLSVAGKRAGLAGERSGLFMEQIRVIKEMRSCGRTDKHGYKLPRYMVWENVPGAFSSAGGEDFRAVLEETCRVADETVTIPRPAKGKWGGAGLILGDNYSVAWRVHDAQYWGVPQRRRRIALVADFGGQSAGEILFERESVSGDPKQSGEERQETAGDAAEDIGETSDNMSVVALEGNGSRPSHQGDGYSEKDVMYTLNAVEQHAVAYGICSYDSNSMKSSNPHSGVYEADTSRTLDNNGGNPSCNQGGMVVIAVENHPADSRVKISDDGMVQTLSSRMGTGGGNTPLIILNDQGGAQMSATAGPLMANGYPDKLTHQDVKEGMYPVANNVVRRLTPTECERLQGYPDGWTDIGEWTDSKGKKHKDADSPRYKALGNSIALPFWDWLLKRIADECDEKTMVSLFDGIGGFPLCWQRAGGETLWVSEIEEFCIAVTETRFGGG